MFSVRKFVCFIRSFSVMVNLYHTFIRVMLFAECRPLLYISSLSLTTDVVSMNPDPRPHSYVYYPGKKFTVFCDFVLHHRGKNRRSGLIFWQKTSWNLPSVSVNRGLYGFWRRQNWYFLPKSIFCSKAETSQMIRGVKPKMKTKMSLKFRAYGASSVSYKVNRSM